jgi:hypothetical protein
MRHQQWNAVLFVLGTAGLCHSRTEKALTLVESTAVIIGLQQYFRSGCVFFLYSTVRTDYGEHTVRRYIIYGLCRNGGNCPYAETYDNCPYEETYDNCPYAKNGEN